jgi:hypothetical protein
MSYGIKFLVFSTNIILRGRRMDRPGGPRDAAVAAAAGAAVGDAPQ